MKNISSFLAIVSILFVQSCTKEQNLEPQDATSKLATQDVPVLVAQAVSTVYPKATTVDFSSLQTKTLFVANVTTPTTQAQMVVSDKGMIKESAVKIAKSELPAAVLTYLESNFPRAAIELVLKKVKGEKLGFRVELVFKNEYYSVFFDERGAFVEAIKRSQNKPGKQGPTPAATEIKLADLPAAVKSTISGYIFKRAILIKDSNGTELYHLRIDKLGVLYDLVVDALGKIIRTNEVNMGGSKFTRIELKTLPAGLTAYLNANAAGYTVNYAVAIMKDSVIMEYHVGVTVGTKKLEFHLNANFLPLQNPPAGPSGNKPPTLEVKQLTVADLPASIKSYLTTNYAGWVLQRGVSTAVGNEIKDFHLIIEVGTKKYMLAFDGKGTFLKAVLL
jgi:hypothetical protein